MPRSTAERRRLYDTVLLKRLNKMNNLTEKQNLRFDLLKANSYDVKNAKACYDFVAGSEELPPAVNTAELPDGIYLMQEFGAPVLFTGQDITLNQKRECTGIGVKLGSKSLVVALNDAADGDTKLTKERGGERFITDYHKAVADWAGKENTESIGDNLNEDIELNDGEFIPSLGQLYFILLHFAAINAALSAVDGEELAETWYWSSTEYSATNAWYLHFGNGYANNNTKASNQYRVRAVSAFLPLNS